MLGCKVKVNRHGFLAFRLFWNKQRSWEGTGLREIKAGKFDYLKWFPEGNRAEELRPKTAAPGTVGEY